MTGRQFSDEGWRTWLEAEQQWYALRGSDLRLALEAGAPHLWVPELEQLGFHEYRRHELALLVASQLPRATDAGHRGLLCQALTRIGSKAAIPQLVESSEANDELLSEQALAALRSITGLEEPLDSPVWRALADGDRPPEADESRALCCGA